MMCCSVLISFMASLLDLMCLPNLVPITHKLFASPRLCSAYVFRYRLLLLSTRRKLTQPYKAKGENHFLILSSKRSCEENCWFIHSLHRTHKAPHPCCPPPKALLQLQSSQTRGHQWASLGIRSQLP